LQGGQSSVEIAVMSYRGPTPLKAVGFAALPLILAGQGAAQTNEQPAEHRPPLQLEITGFELDTVRNPARFDFVLANRSARDLRVAIARHGATIGGCTKVESAGGIPLLTSNSMEKLDNENDRRRLLAVVAAGERAGGAVEMSKDCLVDHTQDKMRINVTFIVADDQDRVENRPLSAIVNVK